MRSPAGCLLLIHGFPLLADMWRFQLSRFPGWTVVCPDLPGFRRSDPDGIRSMGGYAAALEAQLPEGVRPLVVCGFSMGGYIAFEMLRRETRPVDGLILMDTRAEADSDEGKQGRDAMIQMARNEGAAAVAAAMLPKILGPTSLSERPSVVDSVKAMMESVPVPALVAGLRAMRERPDSRGLLPDLRGVRTLVVGGEEDAITPPAGMAALADAIPGAAWASIPAAGHLAPLEAPEPVNRVLEGFLAGV